MFTDQLGEAAVLARNKRLDEVGVRLFMPLKFIIATVVADAAAIPWPESGGPLWCEPDIAGIRAQFHKQGERVALFGADMLPLDDDFATLLAAVACLPDDFILDGEIIASAASRLLSLDDLRKRRSRSVAQADMFHGTSGTSADSKQACFRARDILWHNGHSLLHRPLHERRQWLTGLGLTDPAELVPVRRVGAAEALTTLLQQARAAGHANVLVKNPACCYRPGGHGSGWFKLSTQPVP
jgi:ATP-dependent DNA ligase